MRVLTVDDSRTILAMLHHTLSNAGFEVLQAEDGQQADESPHLRFSSAAVMAASSGAVSSARKPAWRSAMRPSAPISTELGIAFTP